MNTNRDQTLTIGHLDPTRPPFGFFGNMGSLSATWYGTTHELIMNQSLHDILYHNAIDPELSACAIVDHWLWQARHRQGIQFSAKWDSGYSRHGVDDPARSDRNLTPVRQKSETDARTDYRIESQFRHGLYASGMAPIVAANDPLWNVRAFDTALWQHGGYVSYPLICTIHQLVMDQVAEPMTTSAK
jgi:hypothetical protein